MSQPDLWPLDLSEREVAYFAGLFDGEGSIGIYGSKYKASVANTDPRPLFRLKELFGGNVRRADARVTCPSVVWAWEVSGDKAQRFVTVLYPDLIIKKEQADIFLRARKFITVGGPRRPEHQRRHLATAEAELKRLKRLGRPQPMEQEA